jgi:hypothetical protein
MSADSRARGAPVGADAASGRNAPLTGRIAPLFAHTGARVRVRRDRCRQA